MTNEPTRAALTFFDQQLLGTASVAPHIYAFAWLGIPLLFGLDLMRKQVLKRSRCVA
jgi:hypothetical protein